MDGWWGIAEALGLLVLLLALALVLLAGRRRYLARQGGTFECSLRLSTTTPGAGWVLGVGRYNGGELEWFRFFSFAWRPRKSFPRREVRVLETRDPDPVEAVSLYAEQRIVSFEVVGDADGRAWSLALSPDSLTGLLSWLEAAPPGLSRLPGQTP
ncbi:Protein of unknown function [Friedmanniella luteola]|uniref:DUF2550 domain-containing protein n=1 Tax=Friedmanniella luteola TaxID=546871 RepID=A0A1H1V3Z8_9ACTN|nr:DUF2550 domain-containing protein [Friedmanniella luteola]SDS79458.1 Protein of unknown function [Friedmanniella luteola]